MSHVPLKRAKTLLYKNGEMDPHLAELEVQLHQRNSQASAGYIGFLKDNQPVTEEFSDAKELEERVATLKLEDNSVDYIVVNGFEKSS
jgi:hypothetical protein